jgi:hypothetical protein
MTYRFAKKAIWLEPGQDVHRIRDDRDETFCGRAATTAEIEIGAFPINTTCVRCIGRAEYETARALVASDRAQGYPTVIDPEFMRSVTRKMYDGIE